MSHSATHDTEMSHSDDAEKNLNTLIHNIAIRSAEIGKGTIIKRALPSRHKRLIGAWCFLDHAGPVVFAQGDGLDVGPHPHIGLQTFTWMIEGSMLHNDSLGTQQLIRPKQVNLMTAGRGISHTEVAPEHETQMHAAQLWIALPDDKRNMPAQFDHYPELPVVDKDGIEYTVLVGEFLNTTSPVQVHTPLLGVDLTSKENVTTCLKLNAKFEYAFMALEGTAVIDSHSLDQDNLLVLDAGLEEIEIQLHPNSRILLLGGEPFASPIVLWWNFVARTQEELHIAREQWVNADQRFGFIAEYAGARLEAPSLPDHMRASK